MFFIRTTLPAPISPMAGRFAAQRPAVLGGSLAPKLKLHVRHLQCLQLHASSPHSGLLCGRLGHEFVIHPSPSVEAVRDPALASYPKVRACLYYNTSAEATLAAEVGSLLPCSCGTCISSGSVATSSIPSATGEVQQGGRRRSLLHRQHWHGRHR